MRRRLVVSVALAAGFLTGCAGTALASGGTPVCIPAKEGKAIVTPIKGVCKPGYTLQELDAEGKAGPEGKQGPAGPEGKDTFTEEQLALLKSILPYVRYVAVGIGGKPTIQFSGANIQVLNGTNSTENPNGAGNIVIGYDEFGGSYRQTGSHNIILGSRETYTATGGIVGGYANTDEGTNDFVFGNNDKAAEETGGVALLSGQGNEIKPGTAQGTAESAIVGGKSNNVSADESVVAGGVNNTIEGREGIQSVIVGGERNRSHASLSAILGGAANQTNGEAYAADNTITGGAGNNIENAGPKLESTVFGFISGGENNFVKGNGNSVIGGYEDQSTGGFAVLFGGFQGHSASAFAALVGGYRDAVTANYASVIGGKEETASEEYGVK